MKVLIGTDGSAGSREALEIIGALLRSDHDEVVLYYAPPDIRLPFGAQTPDEIRERARDALAESVFDAALAVLPKDLAAKAVTVTGTKPPRQGILLAADEVRADLIVVGAHGTSQLQQLLLGSTSTAVTHGAKVPVLIARRPPYRVAGAPLEVMVACDGSPASQQAGLMLKQFHWPAGTCGRVIAVIESLFAGDVPDWLEQRARHKDSEAMAQAWVAEHESERRAQSDSLMTFCQQLPEAFHCQAPLVVEGHATEQILKAVDEYRVDLLAIGAQNRGALNRWIMGSTSEKLIRHAPCSVLVVRQQEQS